MTRRLINLLWALCLILPASLWAQKDIVSLSAPLTETVYLLGEQARLAAVSDTSLFPEQAIEDRKLGRSKVLTFSNPDLEVIDSLHPSLILTSTAFQRDLVAKLRARGYKVLHFEPESEHILNDSEASELLRRQYRKEHWALPKNV